MDSNPGSPDPGFPRHFGDLRRLAYARARARERRRQWWHVHGFLVMVYLGVILAIASFMGVTAYHGCQRYPIACNSALRADAQ